MQLLLQNNKEVDVEVGNGVPEGRCDVAASSGPKPGMACVGVVGVVVVYVDLGLFGSNDGEMKSVCLAE